MALLILEPIGSILTYFNQNEAHMKTKEELILHLIQQDLLYHRMIYGVQQYEVHIEFYPDFISVILILMGIETESEVQRLTDIYTVSIGEMHEGMTNNRNEVVERARACYMKLNA